MPLAAASTHVDAMIDAENLELDPADGVWMERRDSWREVPARNPRSARFGGSGGGTLGNGSGVTFRAPRCVVLQAPEDAISAFRAQLDPETR